MVPSSDRLEELESCFVGEISVFREAKMVQHNLVMEGLQNTRVISLGDDLVLIQSTTLGEIEKSRSKC